MVPGQSFEIELGESVWCHEDGRLVAVEKCGERELRQISSGTAKCFPEGVIRSYGRA